MASVAGTVNAFFLPIAEPSPCCLVTPLDRASVDLRALKDGPPHSRARVIGGVDRVYDGTPVRREPARGVKYFRLIPMPISCSMQTGKPQKTNRKKTHEIISLTLVPGCGAE